MRKTPCLFSAASNQRERDKVKWKKTMFFRNRSHGTTTRLAMCLIKSVYIMCMLYVHRQGLERRQRKTSEYARPIWQQPLDEWFSLGASVCFFFFFSRFLCHSCQQMKNLIFALALDVSVCCLLCSAKTWQRRIESQVKGESGSLMEPNGFICSPSPAHSLFLL